MVEIKPTASNFIDATVDAYILDNKIVGNVAKICDAQLHANDQLLISIERKVYTVDTN